MTTIPGPPSAYHEPVTGPFHPAPPLDCAVPRDREAAFALVLPYVYADSPNPRAHFRQALLTGILNALDATCPPAGTDPYPCTLEALLDHFSQAELALRNLSHEDLDVRDPLRPGSLLFFVMMAAAPSVPPHDLRHVEVRHSGPQPDLRNNPFTLDAGGQHAAAERAVVQLLGWGDAQVADARAVLNHFHP